MHALLLVAHGSRREASNKEIRDLAERLAQLAAERFDRVVPAFLELAEPSIQAGVDLCAKAGATRVTVVPYFLSQGRHVASDIPKELGKAARKHQGLRIYQCDYLGKHSSIPDLLLALGLDAQSNPVKEPEAMNGTG
jgi:sirohydrochlorin ferrochelatase